MTSNVMPSIVKMEAEVLRQLVAEVKETVATNLVSLDETTKNSSFRAVDLWNVQRKMKSAHLPFRRVI
jgi:hypothetical protein